MITKPTFAITAIAVFVLKDIHIPRNQDFITDIGLVWKQHHRWTYEIWFMQVLQCHATSPSKWLSKPYVDDYILPYLLTFCWNQLVNLLRDLRLIFCFCKARGWLLTCCWYHCIFFIIMLCKVFNFLLPEHNYATLLCNIFLCKHTSFWLYEV